MDKYKYFLGCLNSIGGQTMKRLLDKFGGEYSLYYASDRAIEETHLLTIKQQKELLEARRNVDIDKEWEKVNERDVHMVAMTDNQYPNRLKNIKGLPYMLFYKGELPDENRASVAIIGARLCSEYGRSMARYFAHGLAERGVQIISGLASGIDGISQRTAIECGGDSYGILGSGIDICYPKSNKELYDSLQINGGVISEFPLGTPPISYNFPKRNRIISGLSDIVLVVEAKPRSGTSITVSMALEQGRQVYAVPGRVNDSLSQGCNKMIADGAGVALGLDSVLDEIARLNIIRQEERPVQDSKEALLLNSEIERKIYAYIKRGCNTLELIVRKEGKVSIEELQVLLMEMELKGLIKNNLGLYFVQ